MYPKVDWYSFTIQLDAPFTSKGTSTQEYVEHAFCSLLPDQPQTQPFHKGWTLEPAKGFYFARLRHESSGVALSWGRVNAHILVELSGKACDALESIDCLHALIIETASRATRIDLAVDFLSDVSPERFSAFRNTDKWKHTSYVISASGETFYIGSRKGERMARIYRYYEPHPRAKFLRVEAEYKGDAARALSAEFGTKSLPQICAMAHQPFGWTHELWTQEALEGDRLEYTAFRSTNASTVRWLYGVVASSLRRAIKEGLIDWKEFERLIMQDESED